MSTTFPRRPRDLEAFYATSQLPASRTATAGIPGTWGPAGSIPPPTIAALQRGSPFTVTASPATPWTSGQYVQTQTAGAPGRASWTGSAWVGGAAPLEAQGSTSPTLDPGSFTVAQVEAWVEDHPDEAASVLAAEEGRGDAARVTLLDWLQARLEAS